MNSLPASKGDFRECWYRSNRDGMVVIIDQYGRDTGPKPKWWLYQWDEATNSWSVYTKSETDRVHRAKFSKYRGELRKFMTKKSDNSVDWSRRRIRELGNDPAGNAHYLKEAIITKYQRDLLMAGGTDSFKLKEKYLFDR